LREETGKHDSAVSLAAIIAVATPFDARIVAGMNTETKTVETGPTTNARLTEAEFAAVQDILMDEMGVTRTQITPETVIDDLGADSLTKIEIVMRLEERFQVTIEDEDVEPVRSVEDLCEALAKALRR
jgi:acyl carrier protein